MCFGLGDTLKKGKLVVVELKNGTLAMAGKKKKKRSEEETDEDEGLLVKEIQKWKNQQEINESK